MVYPAQQHVINTFTRLIHLLPPTEKAKPHAILLAGEDTSYRHDTDRELSFRQESNFFYLSGCSVPSSHLLCVYEASTGLSQNPSISLFLHEATISDLMWSPAPPTKEDAKSLFEATSVEYTDKLMDTIQTVAKIPDILFHTLPRGSPKFPVLLEEYTGAILNTDAAISDAYLLTALGRARLTKDAHEIELIERANQISSRAHEVVMRVLGAAVKGKIQREAAAAKGERPLLPGEWLIEKEAEAEAIFVASCRREGSVHQAYLPIVAAASRASTLHYCCNDRDFAWGPVGAHDHKNHNALASSDKDLNPQVLLIDAGCEWDCYASDITRTMPVGNSGKFTPEARAIYELVLEMQKLSMEALRPGIHWDAIQLLCHRTLVRGFQKLGIFLTSESPGSGSWNSEEAILASGVSAAFFPHGVGHSLGMDVHDVPHASKPTNNDTIGNELGHSSFYQYLRLRLPLEEGMVVTVEPGCYFSPHLLASVRDSRHINHEVLKKYESVGGVRIEDVVLITANGHRNLTTVRSDVAWVEGVCSGEL